MDLELAWLHSWLEVVDSGEFARATEWIHLSHHDPTQFPQPPVH